MPKFRLGVDIGGTFTDAVLVDMDTGATEIAKVPSTPKDPSVGFLNAIERVIQKRGVDAGLVAHTVHATTVATNAIIEGKIARSGFITTKGFRDMLEIQRQIRPAPYDFFFDKPAPLIPRELCFEVSERLSPEGNVIKELNEEDVEKVAKRLRDEKVESVAICFLHSYSNPEHEDRAAEIVANIHPSANVTRSHEICSEFREYFRASTSVINAVIVPIVSKYIDKLQKELSSVGLTSDLYVMQSGGGIMTAEMSKKRPAYMVESGPAAGVVMSSILGQQLGYQNLLSFDMGGTTAKAGLVERGVPKMAPNYAVGAAAMPEASFATGGGYPLRTPVLDLVEIGAGGGSIAWIDSGGALKVGPQSAGADPGPACYPKGGKLPTITDANVILGRIDPDHFLGGEMKLNKKAAEAATKEYCGSILGGDVVAIADGIIEVANANMIRALKLVSVERGYDPRDFVVVAFGGAGPMHVCDLCDELKIPEILIPLSPGLASAYGLLMTNLTHNYVQTHIQRMDKLVLAKVNDIYRSFETEALDILKKEGVASQDIVLQPSMDLRYLGQSYELNTTIPGGELGPTDIASISNRFHVEHERVYGHCAREEPIQVVNLRLIATATIAKPRFTQLKKGTGDPKEALRGKRQVYFSKIKGFEESDVYDRYNLKWGDLVEGPAIIEDLDATTVIPPGHTAKVDKYGIISIRKTQ